MKNNPNSGDAGAFCRRNESAYGCALDFPLLFFVTLEGSQMKKVNLDQFYHFGNAVHPLGDLSDGELVKDKKGMLLRAKTWLDYFCGSNMVPLVVCMPQARAILSAIDICQPSITPLMRTWTLRCNPRPTETVTLAHFVMNGDIRQLKAARQSQPMFASANHAAT